MATMSGTELAVYETAQAVGGVTSEDILGCCLGLCGEADSGNVRLSESQIFAGLDTITRGLLAPGKARRVEAVAMHTVDSEVVRLAAVANGDDEDEDTAGGVDRDEADKIVSRHIAAHKARGGSYFDHDAGSTDDDGSASEAGKKGYDASRKRHPKARPGSKHPHLEKPVGHLNGDDDESVPEAVDRLSEMARNL